MQGQMRPGAPQQGQRQMRPGAPQQQGQMRPGAPQQQMRPGAPQQGQPQRQGAPQGQQQGDPLGSLMGGLGNLTSGAAKQGGGLFKSFF